MSPSLPKNKRLSVIKKYLTTSSYEEISKLCGVTERTIHRDIKRWKKNGGFQEFLLKEFLEQYGILKRTKPEFTFTKICDLIKLNRSLFELSTSDEPIDGYELLWRKRETPTT